MNQDKLSILNHIAADRVTVANGGGGLEVRLFDRCGFGGGYHVIAGNLSDDEADAYVGRLLNVVSARKESTPLSVLRFVVGFVAGLADSFASIEVRNRIFGSVAYTGKTVDGFDMAADICSVGRKLRSKVFR